MGLGLDTAGHVLEGFGVLLKLHGRFGGRGGGLLDGKGGYYPSGDQKGGYHHRDDHLFAAVAASSRVGLAYLERAQEPFGGWFGRWACNYLFGTSNVLCGLTYFLDGDEGERASRMVRGGVAWLRSVQNSDGGWGEGLDSYVDVASAGRGKSTPSQTAWALMGLMPYVNADRRQRWCDGDGGLREAVEKGVVWLIAHQDERYFGEGNGATWSEDVYTGTGFPGHFYLGYDFYRHYFPLMALGRYIQMVEGRPLDGIL